MQSWIEGETLGRVFTLYSDEETVQNLAGATVTLIVTKADGSSHTWLGSIVVTNAALGQVTVTPAAGDLLASSSPYSCLFQAVIGGATGFYPSDGADLWHVYSPATGFPRFTFNDLRKQVLRWLDAYIDFDESTPLDLFVKQQLNEAAIARASEYPWPFMRAEALIVTTAAQFDYSLPGGCSRLLYVWSPTDGKYCQEVPVRHLQDESVRFDGQADASGLVHPFERRGSIIHFFEPPLGETLKVGYYRAPSKLLNGSDIPDLPYPHSRLLVWDALLDLKTYSTEIAAARMWIDKQNRAELALYQTYADAPIGAIPQSIHPERSDI